MKGQGGDVTEADENVILDMKRITYWWASGFMIQQYVDGEAVWTEKAKIHTEKSKGIKPISALSLPSVLQEHGRDTGGKATECDPHGGQEGHGQAGWHSIFLLYLWALS